MSLKLFETKKYFKHVSIKLIKQSHFNYRNFNKLRDENYLGPSEPFAPGFPFGL
jgi:hypothetical protein